MESPRIRILVGPIASGKSTYCRGLSERGWVVVNDDAVVHACHAGVYTHYDKALKPLYKSIESHVAAIALAMGRPVVVDRGVNMKRSSRMRWAGMAKSFDVPCEALVFPFAAPPEHARRRAAHDPRGHDAAYWLRVAERHLADYEEPRCSEGIHEVCFMTASGQAAFSCDFGGAS